MIDRKLRSGVNWKGALMGKKGVKQTDVKHGLDVLCQQNNLQFLSQKDGYFNSSTMVIQNLDNRMYFYFLQTLIICMPCTQNCFWKM
jgi:hypothetical protein